ncbi:TIGR03758 family integrating conjugative element protein [Halomonas sabkhae]|uniref:TIGR03758 family integrating conjugative element protein n=1 Tax=Halomonas sabkhae TaxID=626223 RepID=UPI0025B2B99B|nr:TIGR03758 family integrating conjugative element protein [Halomonas sabkhae]MDN3525327.1 TIGR03758 family integrating conjugative element protein [Halomonas sabkhae]
MEVFKNGAGFSASEVAVLIAGVGCVVVILWMAWAYLSTYRGWTKERIDDDVLVSGLMRALMIVLVCLWLFLS